MTDAPKAQPQKDGRRKEPQPAHLSRKRAIRTRLKRQNFGIFWLVIFARRRALLHLPHQNLLKIESFSGRRILRERIFGCCISKNAGNPNGLPSILTQRKRKSASQNRSSDYSLSARHRRPEHDRFSPCARPNIFILLVILRFDLYDFYDIMIINERKNSGR